MLYVIVTNDVGAVRTFMPCENGIDQAIELIAEQISHPEEDWAAACDVVAEEWARAVRVADYHGGKAETVFAINRSDKPLRFGLVVI